MKVYFDARMIDHPGIGRYIRCLLPHIVSDASIDLRLLGNREKINKMLPFKIQVIDFNHPIYSVQEQVGFLKLKRIIGNDTLHVPHYNVPILAKFNMVVTIHDIIHILYPQGAKNRFGSAYMKFMVGRALASARQVICVSNATKESVETVFGAKRGNISVVYEGIDEAFKKISDKNILQRIKEKHKLPDKFILYVGSVRRHKNIEGLLDAFRRLNEKVPDVWLVIVGRYSQPIDLNRPKVLYLGEVASDMDLAGIYNQALCLLNLSLYEGFGLTILEAQSCGLPVVCSDIPPHKEIGGNGIAAVRVSYIDQVYENLYNVLLNIQARETLIQNGLKNAGNYNWRSTAKNTIEAYRKSGNEGSDSPRLVNGHEGRGKGS